MYIICNSFDYPIAQTYQDKTSDDACQYVADETSCVSVLEHLHALIGKGRKGGETSTNTRSKEQIPRIGYRAVFAEKGEYKAENKASQKIDGECPPWETLSTYVLHYR